MVCTRVLKKRLSLSEFDREHEAPFKYFRVRYTSDGVLFYVREFQEKFYVRRIVENPNNYGIQIELMEVVDDG